MKIPSILTVSLYLGAFSGVAAAAWTVGEFTETRPALLKELRAVMAQTEQNTYSINVRELSDLEEKRKISTLTVEENIRRCVLARAVGWPVEGC